MLFVPEENAVGTSVGAPVGVTLVDALTAKHDITSSAILLDSITCDPCNCLTILPHKVIASGCTMKASGEHKSNNDSLEAGTGTRGFGNPRFWSVGTTGRVS